MIEFFEENNLFPLVNSLVAIVLFILGYRLFVWFMKSKLGKNSEHRVRDTYLMMLGNVGKYFYLAIAVITILAIYGVDVSAMVASLGVASAFAGLAMQDTLKNILRGFSLISEQYYKIGDYITIGDLSGTVVAISLQSTKIKNGATGDVITIANSEIKQVSRSSRLLNLDIPLPYELKLSKAEAIIAEIVERAKKLEYVQECEYRAVSSLGDSAINYRVYIKCSEKRSEVKRNFWRLVLEVLEEKKVSVPYPQLTIHNEK